MKRTGIAVFLVMMLFSNLQAAENEARVSDANTNALPIWVQRLKINGDLRFRYQNEDKDTYRRERARIRFRLQALTKPAEDWLVSWGFATGGSDPRSTNQSFDDGFETKAINLDYAYGAYNGVSGLSVKTGKIPVKKAIQTHGDLLWDSDIGVEGISANYNSPPGDLRFFANVNYLIMDYVSNGNDPSMTVIQPGVTAKLGADKKLKINIAQYKLSGHKNAPVFAQSASAGASNTLIGNNYMYDYNCTSFGFDLSFQDLYFEKVSFFGEYVTNPDPSQENTGILAGVIFGAKKLKLCGQWQAKFMYRNLGTDAWMDWLPDSDARSGRTDTAGPEIILSYGLAENVTFGLDYYISGEAKKEPGDKPADLAQFDIIYKF